MRLWSVCSPQHSHGCQSPVTISSNALSLQDTNKNVLNFKDVGFGAVMIDFFGKFLIFEHSPIKNVHNRTKLKEGTKPSLNLMIKSGTLFEFNNF